ncbi:MAG: AraC family transcriptional regulator [Pseudomonadota bacterium]
METLNIIIRGEVIGASILIATILFIQKPYEQISWATGGLVMTLLFENARSFAQEGVLSPTLDLPLYIGVGLTPFFFAWHVLLLFNDAPLTREDAPKGTFALLICTVMAFVMSLLHVVFKAPIVFCQLLSIISFLGTVAIVLASAKDDLVDRRRNARTFFVTIMGFFGAFVMSVELVELSTTATEVIGIFKGAMIFVFLICAAIFLFQPFPEVASRKPTNPQSGSRGDVSDWIEVKIEKHMQDGVWAEEGLTISSLADRVGAPEYLVRRTINQRMGFRNFPTFVNSYRIKAAQELLSNPEMSRKSVLEIAYEVGFASLGPFNKAFRDFAAITPTEFRKQTFEAHSSIPENIH